MHFSVYTGMHYLTVYRYYLCSQAAHKNPPVGVVHDIYATWLFQKKKQKGGGLMRTYPGNFRQNKAPPPEIPQFFINLEILRPKTKTPGNYTLFFLGHPGKFQIIFN